MRLSLQKDSEEVSKKWNLFLQGKKKDTLSQFQAVFQLILVSKMWKKTLIQLSDTLNTHFTTLKNVVKTKSFSSLK